eukprot:RCo020814
MQRESFLVLWIIMFSLLWLYVFRDLVFWHPSRVPFGRSLPGEGWHRWARDFPMGLPPSFSRVPADHRITEVRLLLTPLTMARWLWKTFPPFHPLACLFSHPHVVVRLGKWTEEKVRSREALFAELPIQNAHPGPHSQATPHRSGNVTLLVAPPLSLPIPSPTRNSTSPPLRGESPLGPPHGRNQTRGENGAGKNLAAALAKRPTGFFFTYEYHPVSHPLLKYFSGSGE